MILQRLSIATAPVYAMGLRSRPLRRRRPAPLYYLRYGFRHRPCILDALSQRTAHGVFGYSRWKNDEFLGAVAHWYASRFHCPVNRDAIVYGPSVIYMVAEMIRQWSDEGDGVVVHTPAYDAFIKPLKETGVALHRCR